MEFYLFTKFHESQNIEGKPCERWTTGVKITLETTGIVKKTLAVKMPFSPSIKKHSGHHYPEKNDHSKLLIQNIYFLTKKRIQIFY